MIKLLAFTWLGVLVLAIGALFWYNDIIYQLPTPIPANYKAVPTGTKIQLKGLLANNYSKPTFLHFFNPSCPCSKFNIPHFRALVQQYGAQVNFAVVVINGKGASARQIQQKLGVTVPVTFDTSLAAACGVYSTPQVALLDAGGRLYYRGNYNRGRYCADEQTNFAKIAISGVLQGFARPFSPLAIRSYGCEVISCKK